RPRLGRPPLVHRRRLHQVQQDRRPVRRQADRHRPRRGRAVLPGDQGRQLHQQRRRHQRELHPERGQESGPRPALRRPAGGPGAPDGAGGLAQPRQGPAALRHLRRPSRPGPGGPLHARVLPAARHGHLGRSADVGRRPLRPHLLARIVDRTHAHAVRRDRHHRVRRHHRRLLRRLLRTPERRGTEREDDPLVARPRLRPVVPDDPGRRPRLADRRRPPLLAGRRLGAGLRLLPRPLDAARRVRVVLLHAPAGQHHRPQGNVHPGRVARHRLRSRRQGGDGVSLRTQLSDILHERTSYDFIGPTMRWFAISGIVIIIGLVALGTRGLNLGIDFKGGTAWQVTVHGKSATTAGARNAAESAGLTEPSVQILGGSQARVESKRATPDEQTKVANALAAYANAKPTDVSINDVGPTWGGEVSHKAIRALVFFFIAIAIYLSFRVEPKMAIAAIVAVVHDILVTVGAYAVTGFEVSPATVIAFLTILGFSLYDTVVVFDKVEENVTGIGATGRETYSGVVNRSMNEVLMRSLNTSFVAVLPVFSLLFVGAYLFGAVTIKDFSLALFIGL